MDAVDEYIKKAKFKLGLAEHIKGQTMVEKTDVIAHLLDEVKQGINEEEQMRLKTPQ